MTELHFGKYQVHRLLERGGMGAVYLGRIVAAHGFERPVVIKTIRTELVADPRMAMMFVDEARIAARLHHRNIVQTLDFDVAGDCAYLVTEYVEGCDLRVLLMQMSRRLPYELAVAIVAELATGLHAAHEARGDDGELLDLVHRDLTPSNVLLGTAGEVKLADFGIARARSRSYHTMSGTIKGKAAYMAPEQIMGLPLDRRADLFSLGILMFEMTTRTRLYSALGDATAMRTILHGDVPDPRERVARYPDALAAIVQRLLARAPEARFATAGEVVHALDDLGVEHGWTLSTPQIGTLAGLVRRQMSAAMTSERSP